MLKIGVIQLNCCDDPKSNLVVTKDLIRAAAADGAKWVLTPEVTNVVSTCRQHQNSVLQVQSDDQTLAALRTLAADLKIWLTIGSLALATDDPDGRFANRSFMITPTGDVSASYDKIHMFDAQITDGEGYRESDGFRPGKTVPIVETPFGRVGMTICFDLRFPDLYRDLAQSGAEFLTVPSAFTVPTGQAHWHTLLRARAIETGCFVIAPAQVGDHNTKSGISRKTYGHSLVVDPWGTVLLDAGDGAQFCVLDLDRSKVEQARCKIPALKHNKPYRII